MYNTNESVIIKVAGIEYHRLSGWSLRIFKNTIKILKAMTKISVQNAMLFWRELLISTMPLPPRLFSKKEKAKDKTIDIRKIKPNPLLCMINTNK